MANLDDLWNTLPSRPADPAPAAPTEERIPVGLPPIVPAPPVPAPHTQPASASPPADASAHQTLQQQLNWTQQMLGTILTRQTPPVEKPTTPASEKPLEIPTFFTPDDIEMILNAPKEQLGDRWNRVLRTAVELPLKEVQALRQQNEALQKKFEDTITTGQREREHEVMRNTFFAAYPDLAGDTPQVREVNQLLVAHAVQKVAQVQQATPWKYPTQQIFMDAVAEEARGLRKLFLPAAPATELPAAALPLPGARRKAGQVDTGGSTRVSVPTTAKSKDPQLQAMNEMIHFVNGGGR